MKLPTSQQETEMKTLEKLIIDQLLFNKEKKHRSSDRQITFKQYMKFKKELEEFEKWEKSMLKKDVKQEEKKHGPALSTIHIAMILIASFPITAPLYVWWIKSFLP